MIYVKHGEAKTFVIVDAAMNDLIRPTLYDAHHDILPVREPASAAPRHADVVGPVCEIGDFLAQNRDPGRAAAGDLLAVMTAGAYGAVQAGTYNSRRWFRKSWSKPPNRRLVRPRVYEELIALDRLPAWL